MGSVSVRVFQLVVAGAAAGGVAPADLLAAAGIAARDLADPDGRLSRVLEARLWHAAARLTGDDAFGPHLAERVAPDGFGALGFALRSSPTLGDAYARLSRFLRLVAHGPVMTTTVEGAVVRLGHAPPPTPPPPSRHAVEFLLTVLVDLARRGVDAAYLPRAVTFRHPAPARLDEHQRLLGPGVRFDAAHDEVVIDRDRCDRAQRHAEPALARVLDDHLAQQLGALGDEDASVVDRTRRALFAELDHGEPAIEVIAARLRMSPRSLQRRLKQEGASLTGVLDRLREELARRYLDEARDSIGEVAFRLGFSDPSTFHRAFRRWTGLTPAAYRRRPLGQGDAPA